MLKNTKNEILSALANLNAWAVYCYNRGLEAGHHSERDTIAHYERQVYNNETRRTKNPSQLTQSAAHDAFILGYKAGRFWYETGIKINREVDDAYSNKMSNIHINGKPIFEEAFHDNTRVNVEIKPITLNGSKLRMHDYYIVRRTQGTYANLIGKLVLVVRGPDNINRILDMKSRYEYTYHNDWEFEPVRIINLTVE